MAIWLATVESLTLHCQAGIKKGKIMHRIAMSHLTMEIWGTVDWACLGSISVVKCGDGLGRIVTTDSTLLLLTTAQHSKQ